MKSCKDKILPGDDVAVQGRNTEMYCQFFLEKNFFRIVFYQKSISSSSLISLFDTSGADIKFSPWKQGDFGMVWVQH